MTKFNVIDRDEFCRRGHGPFVAKFYYRPGSRVLGRQLVIHQGPATADNALSLADETLAAEARRATADTQPSRLGLRPLKAVAAVAGRLCMSHSDAPLGIFEISDRAIRIPDEAGRLVIAGITARRIPEEDGTGAITLHSHVIHEPGSGVIPFPIEREPTEFTYLPREDFGFAADDHDGIAAIRTAGTRQPLFGLAGDENLIIYPSEPLDAAGSRPSFVHDYM